MSKYLDKDGLTRYNAGINTKLAQKANASDLSAINAKIPAQASANNQLADKDFVNSSLNSIVAFYITRTTSGEAFESVAQLNSTTTFYSGGVERVPTRNDYCIVRVDENHDNATTRYIYQNNQWEYQYTVNETALTAEQLAAINSGITSALVNQINTNTNAIATKQNLINVNNPLPYSLLSGTPSALPVKGSRLSNNSNGKVFAFEISTGYLFLAFGNSNSISGTGSKTINFTASMTYNGRNATFVKVIANEGNSGASNEWANSFRITSASSTGFTIEKFNSEDVTYNFIAIGIN